MRDFIQDTDGDLNLDNGDIIMGEATLQHQRDCILTRAGSMKHAPARGVGVEDYFNDESQEDLLRKIRQELIKDGMKIDKIETGVTPQIMPKTIIFKDWFLPSKDELKKMYDELYLFGVGGFSNGSYWNSSEVDAETIWYLNFAAGLQLQTGKEGYGFVRACRSFTAGIGEYSLRDTGPGGGLIFYISGTSYLEAAPNNQSTNYQWSNIAHAAVTGTFTAIGTGQANTAAIIAQDGHINSAALLCANYSNSNVIPGTDSESQQISINGYYEADYND